MSEMVSIMLILLHIYGSSSVVVGFNARRIIVPLHAKTFKSISAEALSANVKSNVSLAFCSLYTEQNTFSVVRTYVRTNIILAPIHTVQCMYRKVASLLL